jgi:hypothetical protein
MCTQLDKYGFSVTLPAQRLIAIYRKVRFGAQRLIVRLIWCVSTGETWGISAVLSATLRAAA